MCNRVILVFLLLQLVPLLLVTDHKSGGYNMDDSEIGIVLMSVAIIQLLWLVCNSLYTMYSGTSK